MSDPLKFEKVSVEDARRSLDLPSAAGHTVEEQDWRWARSFKPPVALTDETKAWLAKLPVDVRPTELSAAFPRIANRLCEAWGKPDECDRYFESLGVVRNNGGRRRGFSASVAREIETLRAFHSRPPAEGLLWDATTYRNRR